MPNEIIKTLKAEEGMIWTDSFVFGKTVILPTNRTEDEFYEITEAEYANILKEQEDGTEIC